jgi:hypothetical protein
MAASSFFWGNFLLLIFFFLRKQKQNGKALGNRFEIRAIIKDLINKLLLTCTTVCFDFFESVDAVSALLFLFRL